MWKIEVWKNKDLLLEKMSSEHELLIGRDASCNICLNDAQVSRRHAKLLFDGNQLTVVDLGSSNGTTGNGRAVDPSVQYTRTVQLGIAAYQLTVRHQKSRTIETPAAPQENHTVSVNISNYSKAVLAAIMILVSGSFALLSVSEDIPEESVPAVTVPAGVDTGSPGPAHASVSEAPAGLQGPVQTQDTATMPATETVSNNMQSGRSAKAIISASPIMARLVEQWPTLSKNNDGSRGDPRRKISTPVISNHSTADSILKPKMPRKDMVFQNDPSGEKNTDTPVLSEGKVELAKQLYFKGYQKMQYGTRNALLEAFIKFKECQEAVPFASFEYFQKSSLRIEEIQQMLSEKSQH